MSSFHTGLLAKIAAIGGFAVVGSGYYFQGRIEHSLKQAEYYKKSFQILKSNTGIAYYMGAPIYDGKLDLGDTKNNYCTGKEAKFEVPVKGSKKKGTFYIFATRKEYSEPWDIQRLELGIEDKPGERILVYDPSKNL